MPRNIIVTESLNISAHGAVNIASKTTLKTTFFISLNFCMTQHVRSVTEPLAILCRGVHFLCPDLTCYNEVLQPCTTADNLFSLTQSECLVVHQSQYCLQPCFRFIIWQCRRHLVKYSIPCSLNSCRLKSIPFRSHIMYANNSVSFDTPSFAYMAFFCVLTV